MVNHFWTNVATFLHKSLQWRHNQHGGVSNNRRLDCLLHRLFRRRSKKISKLRVTGLCEGNLPLAGVFHVQKASNAENPSIWWRHHVFRQMGYVSLAAIMVTIFLMPILKWNPCNSLETLRIFHFQVRCSDDVIKWLTFRVAGPFSVVNSSVNGEFTSQKPVMRSFYVFFDLHLNKRLSEQSRRRQFNTPLCLSWCHCNVICMLVFCQYQRWWFIFK